MLYVDFTLFFSRPSNKVNLLSCHSMLLTCVSHTFCIHIICSFKVYEKANKPRIYRLNFNSSWFEWRVFVHILAFSLVVWCVECSSIEHSRSSDIFWWYFCHSCVRRGKMHGWLLCIRFKIAFISASVCRKKNFYGHWGIFDGWDRRIQFWCGNRRIDVKNEKRSKNYSHNLMNIILESMPF